MSKTTKIILIVTIVLVVILVITIPTTIFIYNQGREVYNEGVDTIAGSLDSIDQIEIEAFNNKFTMYEGNNLRGTQINSLIQTIRDNNEQNPDRKIQAMASVNNWDTENNQADTQSSYKVTCEIDSETGYVNVVKIEDAD